MHSTKITSLLRCHCFEFTLDGRAGGRAVAEQVDRLNHPHAISLWEHGHGSHGFLSSCKSGLSK